MRAVIAVDCVDVTHRVVRLATTGKENRASAQHCKKNSLHREAPSATASFWDAYQHFCVFYPSPLNERGKRLSFVFLFIPSKADDLQSFAKPRRDRIHPRAVF